ncbi:MAG: OmpA family protein [Armatimonadota bacterium]|nr:MAG: OmpA family protein [Armatimonadota bacterium]
MSIDIPEQESAGGDNEGAGMMRWLLTYADMITLLMAFFIMMYSMSVISSDKFKRAASSLRAEFGPAEARRSLTQGSGLLPYARPGDTLTDLPALEEALQLAKDQLEEYIKKNDLQDVIQTSHESRGLVITLVSDNLLFPVGAAELRSPALVILNRIAGLLRTMPNRIVIEGHTCSLPISTPRYPSNWELSAARACAVVRYLIDRWQIDSLRLAATGYADSRPVASNDDEEGRSFNRRVEVIILPTANPSAGEEPAAPETRPPSRRSPLLPDARAPASDPHADLPNPPLENAP